VSEYSFTLRFRIPSGQVDPELHVGALLRAGCDDATVGIGRRGYLSLMFTRRATSGHRLFATLDVPFPAELIGPLPLAWLASGRNCSPRCTC